MALNHWIELNDLDIICIQEWFVSHGRQTINEHKCNQVNLYDNNSNNSDGVNVYNSYSDNDSDSDYVYERFEGENKNDPKYLTVTLDMTEFPKYSRVETNSKTVILYRNGLSIIDLGNIDPISSTGLDVTWIGIESNCNVVIVGNVYHSPSIG